MFTWWWWLLLVALVPLWGMRRWLRRQGMLRRYYRVADASIRKRTNHTQSGKIVYYRSTDGKADYGFSIKQRGNGYQIDIVSQPSYGGRKTDCHSTHRLRGGNGYYICWAGLLTTETQARQVAALWADGTQKYIRHGTRF